MPGKFVGGMLFCGKLFGGKLIGVVPSGNIGWVCSGKFAGGNLFSLGNGISPCGNGNAGWAGPGKLAGG